MTLAAPNDVLRGLNQASGWRGICPECRTPVSDGKTFCSPAHKTAFHNRSSARGRVVIPLLMCARIQRNRAGTSATRAWSEARTLLDRYAAEDKAAGRMSAVDYVAGKWAGGF